SRRSLAVRERLVADFPGVPEYRRNLAGVNNNVAMLLLEDRGLSKEEAPAAGRHLLKTLELRQQLVAEFSDNHFYRLELAHAHDRLGLFLTEHEQRPRAIENFRQAADLFAALIADFPKNVGYRYEMGATLHNLAF